MFGRVLPYSDAETAAAATWLTYVDEIRAPVLADPAASVQELDDVTAEAIDKLERRGAVSWAVAELLAEVFDLPRAAVLELA